jgi:hypothetical protein
MQTMSDITMPSAPRSAISQIVADIRTASPPIYATVLAMAGLAIVGLALQMIDHREIIGQNVWDKPTKFFAGVAIQFGTVGWALSFFTAEERARRSIRWPALIMLAAGWLEMAYILFRASRGEASHFNDTTQLAVILYGLMGLGAITMTGIAFIYGLRLWRRRSRGLWTEAAGLGLMAGSLLGTLAGGYMSAQTSHWVGGLASDATGVGFFGWSTSGGDLRIAHFMGLHAGQLVPFAAVSGSRRVVWLTVAAAAIMTLALFVQAFMGVPLFRA